jgi:LppP/LprE lipoprotein
VVVVDDATSAEQLVRSRGYVPGDTTDFATPAQSGLHVIVATAAGSADGRGQRAFFFRNRDFLGTDLKMPSATVKVAWRNDSTIALSYAAYKTGDPLCCPTGGAMIVRYKLTGNRLKPLDPIPPVSVRR